MSEANGLGDLELSYDESLVTTTLGNIRKADLAITMIEQQETADVWVVARECKYTGVDHPDAFGTVVRRDVWVTMKTGQAARAEQPESL